jgi:hypothetical protein
MPAMWTVEEWPDEGKPQVDTLLPPQPNPERYAATRAAHHAHQFNTASR